MKLKGCIRNSIKKEDKRVIINIIIYELRGELRRIEIIWLIIKRVKIINSSYIKWCKHIINRN